MIGTRRPIRCAVNPMADLSDSDKAAFFDSLQRMGIQPKTELVQSGKGDEQTQRTIIPGAIVRYKDRSFPVDLLKGGNIQLAIYTTTGATSFADEKAIRRSAVTYRVPCITTMSGARAAVEAVAAKLRDPIRVWSLQEIHEAKKTTA